MPDRMPWDEAYRLAVELAKDPGSRVSAAIGQLEEPWSREAHLIADVYDVLVASNTPARRKIAVHPRPERQARLGRPSRSQHEIRAALAARGH